MNFKIKVQDNNKKNILNFLKKQIELILMQGNRLFCAMEKLKILLSKNRKNYRIYVYGILGMKNLKKLKIWSMMITKILYVLNLDKLLNLY